VEGEITIAIAVPLGSPAKMVRQFRNRLKQHVLIAPFSVNGNSEAGGKQVAHFSRGVQGDSESVSDTTLLKALQKLTLPHLYCRFTIVGAVHEGAPVIQYTLTYGRSVGT
jgi:hypothetical protein